MIMWILVYLLLLTGGGEGWEGNNHRFNWFMMTGVAEFALEAALVLIKVLN